MDNPGEVVQARIQSPVLGAVRAEDAVAFVASEFDLYDPASRLYYVPIDATILFVP